MFLNEFLLLFPQYKTHCGFLLGCFLSSLFMLYTAENKHSYLALPFNLPFEQTIAPDQFDLSVHGTCVIIILCISTIYPNNTMLSQLDPLTLHFQSNVFVLSRKYWFTTMTRATSACILGRQRNAVVYFLCIYLCVCIIYVWFCTYLLWTF